MMVWKFVVVGFQLLDIYKDFICANQLIRKNMQSNTTMKISKYLIGRKVNVLRMEYISFN